MAKLRSGFFFCVFHDGRLGFGNCILYSNIVIKSTTNAFDMRPVILLFSILAFSAGIHTPAIAQNGPQVNLPKIESREKDMRQDMSRRIQAAWQDNDFKTLEAMGQDYLDQSAKSYSGKSMLTLFLSDLDGRMKIEWPKEWNVKGQSNCNCISSDPERYPEADRRWTVIDDKLKTWTKRYPHSVILPLAKINYLTSRAWFYRGSGFADDVSPQAWPLFGRYMKEADKTLKASASIRYKNPGWYAEAARIGVVDDWPQVEREHLYADMVEHAGGYVQAYVIAAQFLQPNWGGDYAEIDELIKRAQKRLPEKEGLEFYARVYWNYLGSGYIPNSDPRLTTGDWNVIKQGLEIVTDRYPDRMNFEGAARLACRYRDRPLFAAMTRRLGTYEWYEPYSFDFIDCSKPDFMLDRFPTPVPLQK